MSNRNFIVISHNVVQAADSITSPFRWIWSCINDTIMDRNSTTVCDRVYEIASVRAWTYSEPLEKEKKNPHTSGNVLSKTDRQCAKLTFTIPGSLDP